MPVMPSARRIPGRRTGNRIALVAMNATAPVAGNLYLVVGYDGSPPAVRALDAAIRLLQGRTGSIEVVYVAHLSGIDSLSPGATISRGSFTPRPASSCATTRSAGGLRGARASSLTI
jgi:CO/xanthine dehydrogenase FAD-binding subunit